jgi:hypothetical protein
MWFWILEENKQRSHILRVIKKKTFWLNLNFVKSKEWQEMEKKGWKEFCGDGKLERDGGIRWKWLLQLKPFLMDFLIQFLS